VRRAAWLQGSLTAWDAQWITRGQLPGVVQRVEAIMRTRGPWRVLAHQRYGAGSRAGSARLLAQGTARQTVRGARVRKQRRLKDLVAWRVAPFCEVSPASFSLPVRGSGCSPAALGRDMTCIPLVRL
jgi:hypothetical protein